jgi:translation initiation factor 2A
VLFKFNLYLYTTAAGTYADRAISPGSIRKEGEVSGGAGGVAIKKPAAYKPPHATSGAGNFSLAKAAPEDSGPGKYRAAGAVAPPGASGNASKASGPPGGAAS